jgi:hypothetical protein
MRPVSSYFVDVHFFRASTCNGFYLLRVHAGRHSKFPVAKKVSIECHENCNVTFIYFFPFDPVLHWGCSTGILVVKEVDYPSIVAAANFSGPTELEVLEGGANFSIGWQDILVVKVSKHGSSQPLLEG